MSTADGSQLRNVQRHQGTRVVFDASGSYVESKMTNDLLWLRERDGVYVVNMLVAPARREQKSKPSVVKLFQRPFVVTDAPARVMFLFRDGVLTPASIST